MARIFHTATSLLDGRVLVVVGANSTESIATAEIYDEIRGAFTVSASTSESRGSHTATLLPNGKVLVAGGDHFTPEEMANTTLSSAELYDPGSGQFASTGAMNGPRHSHTATLLAAGKVLVVGGGNREAELYW